MLERVDVREWIEFQYPYLLTFLGGREHVARLAHETGAFTRAREVRSPEDLLRLILMWSAGEQSFDNVAAIAAEAGLADLSDVALVKRFAKAGDWLTALLGDVLADAPTAVPPTLRIRIVDATTVGRAGKKGTDHRIHLGMNLATNRMDTFELTDAKGGESLERFAVRPGEITICDAGCGHRAGLAHVARGGGFFVTRFAWTNLPLEAENGERVDIIEVLRSLPEAAPTELPVRFQAPDGEYFPARLVALRKSEPAAAAARKRVLEERSKRGRNVDVRTLEVAGYTFVLTNLPPELSTAAVLDLYRFRWQIEMKFKTLKSVLKLGDVPARTEQGLRVYVLAKLLVAVLIEYLIDNAESFSPWGYPIAPVEQLANDTALS
jgi:hypothetical protein